MFKLLGNGNFQLAVAVALLISTAGSIFTLHYRAEECNKETYEFCDLRELQIIKLLKELNQK